MLFLYRIGIWFYQLAILLASPVAAKARAFREGRKDIFKRLDQDLKKRKGKLVWIHAASLGEFEQGRPVIEAIKDWDPTIEILLTFFSPSGYEIRKDYPLASYVYYLPLDFKNRARRFVAIARPDLAIFIKYELWYYYLMALHSSKVPIFVISAVFRPDQLYFQKYASFFQPALRGINHFFVQNTQSGSMLSSLGIEQYTVAGDSRFDRVRTVAESPRPISLVDRFRAGEPVIVMGSVWEADLEILKPYILQKLPETKVIIAPHQVGKAMISRLLQLPGSILYTQAREETISDYRILIIDTIGMLARLYRYGDFAYVGGGKRGALHNILEPAVYGMPVFFGRHKNNTRFVEAVGLLECGGAFELEDSEGLIEKFDELTGDQQSYTEVCEAARSYVMQHTGATSRIMEGIKKWI